MVTYLIDVNHISLGNVVGHYGYPEAVEKTNGRFITVDYTLLVYF